MLDDYDLSDSDRAQLARPEVMQIFREATVEWAFNGVGGWVDDDLAFTRPWGFDVADIKVPVLVVYGTADVLVPPAHGEWLAGNVPDCLVKIEEGGHLGSRSGDRHHGEPELAQGRSCAGRRAVEA